MASLKSDKFGFATVVGVVVLITLGGIATRGVAEEAQGGFHHVVGGDRGWAAASDIAAWSTDRVFRVGDHIWFTYSAAQGSIAELRSREEFESCDLSNPIRMYTDGLNKLTLEGEGTRYFASYKPNNCRNGLKLDIQVLPQATEKNSVIVAHAAAAGPAIPSGSAGLGAPLLMWFGLGLLCYMGF